MKQKIDKPQPQPEVSLPPFKGYTIEELRYRRAMMALKKEFCKEKAMQSLRGLSPSARRKDKGGSSKSSKLALAGQIATKVFSNLNTLDYILMGISLFTTARKGIRLIRGKK